MAQSETGDRSCVIDTGFNGGGRCVVIIELGNIWDIARRISPRGKLNETIGLIRNMFSGTMNLETTHVIVIPILVGNQSRRKKFGRLEATPNYLRGWMLYVYCV